MRTGRGTALLTLALLAGCAAPSTSCAPCDRHVAVTIDPKTDVPSRTFVRVCVDGLGCRQRARGTSREFRIRLPVPDGMSMASTGGRSVRVWVTVPMRAQWIGTGRLQTAPATGTCGCTRSAATVRVLPVPEPQLPPR